jgi:hypothetical protein
MIYSSYKDGETADKIYKEYPVLSKKESIKEKEVISVLSLSDFRESDFISSVKLADDIKYTIMSINCLSNDTIELTDVLIAGSVLNKLKDSDTIEVISKDERFLFLLYIPIEH